MDRAILVIRALGFVGNSHYCPHCMNHFHDDRGQHDPDCGVLAEIQEDDQWWEDVAAKSTGLATGSRVFIVGAHPWNSYAGKIVGAWPSSELDWLVALDNGQNIGAKTGDLRACA